MREFLKGTDIEFYKLSCGLALATMDTKYTYLRDRLLIRCNKERLQFIYGKLISKSYDYMEGLDLNNYTILAKILSECLPKDSLATLKQKASRNDPDTLLQLHDYYCLDPEDYLKHEKYFNNRTFSNCKHPEYITTKAYGYFFFIQRFLNCKEIPANCKLTAAKGYLEKMWSNLEEALKLGHVSRFLILQAQSALKTGSWDLTHDVKRALVKVRVEIAKKQQENKSYIDNILNCRIIDSNTENPETLESLLQNKLTNNDVHQTYFKKYMEGIEHHRNFKAESYDGILSSVRQRLIDGTITVDELLQRGDIKFERNNFSGAIKLYTLGIDQMQQSITILNTSFKLAKLMAGRAKSNLKIAQLRRSKEYCELSLKDTDFILKSESFDIKSVKYTDLDFYQQLVKLNDQAQILLKNLDMAEISRPNNTQQSNRSTVQEKKNASKTNENTTSAKIRVILSDKLSESNSDHDSCPMCWESWSEKIEPSVIVILPCDHSCCAKCLQKFEKMCSSNKMEFQCSLCRFALKALIIKEIARLVVKQNLFESFKKLSEMLPFNKDHKEKLIISLLIKHAFNVSLVESDLFEMIGLYISSNIVEEEDKVLEINIEERNTEDLSHEEKQKYYEVARAPVLKLQNELKIISKKLQDFSDVKGNEWFNEMLAELKDVRSRLDIARQNAANDIFERVNSSGKMGVIMEDESDASGVFVDLHGLHVNEAKSKLNELILPMLSDLKKITLITGHGSHAKSGESTLKKAVSSFLKEKKIRFQDDPSNKGALCIFDKM